MPKIKSHSAATKRFKLTGTGKIKRHHAGVTHILTKKTRKRKRRLGSATLVKECDVPRLKRMLVY